MCGITGWVDGEHDLTQERAVLSRMAATLQPRGPDALGTWVSPHAALAHRRLIVIDPEGGTQPMCALQEQASLVLTYNGELYNFRDLRRELEDRGYAFQTRSDTEVILHAYQEWDIDCLHHFNGIFAFALWDERQQRLFLARDPLGVKPLFYAQRGSALIFGSELKALLAHSAVRPALDLIGLSELLTMFASPDHGLFREVKQLRAGYALTWTRERTRVWQYWALQSPPHPDDVETTAAHIRQVLEDTVQRQLIADVPVVTLLSGGLDSSGITALAQRVFQREGKTLPTYSIDFADSAQHFQGSAVRPSLDGPYIEQMVAHLGTLHHTVVVDTPALLEHFLVPMRAYDRPRMGQMDTSLYLLCRAIKQEATVALSGESADEVFGGYPWFYQPEIWQAGTFPWTRTRQGYRELLREDVQTRLPGTEYEEQCYRQALAEVPHCAEDDPQTAQMRDIFYLHLTRFLPMLLDRKDRMSMAVGLEVRVPFCDPRLVQYVWNIPWAMKTCDGREKGILRRALWDVLPEAVRERKKSAYPSTFDPAYVQAVQQWVARLLEQTEAPLWTLFDPSKVRALLAQPSTAVPTEMGTPVLDFLIQTNSWLDTYQVILPI